MPALICLAIFLIFVYAGIRVFIAHCRFMKAVRQDLLNGGKGKNAK